MNVITLDPQNFGEPEILDEGRMFDFSHRFLEKRFTPEVRAQIEVSTSSKKKTTVVGPHCAVEVLFSSNKDKYLMALENAVLVAIGVVQ